MSVIKCLEFATGQPSRYEGMYLKAYDPDGREGMGHIEWTPNRWEAMQFTQAFGALDTWRRQSTVHPLRPDGKPNRPLTAYSIVIEP